MFPLFTDYLADVFPDHQPKAAPECWITRALDPRKREYVNGAEWARALAVVEASGQSQELRDKLREQHPFGRVHKGDYDNALLDVLTEMYAFAWAADIALHGRPQFEPRRSRRSPDISILPDWWVEAKRIRTSLHGRELLSQMDGDRVVVGPANMGTPELIEQFDSKMDDALDQFAAVSATQGVVFFGFEEDMDSFSDDTVIEWTRRRSSPAFHIVICKSSAWGTEVVPTLVELEVAVPT